MKEFRSPYREEARIMKVHGDSETFFKNIINFFQTLIFSEGKEIQKTFCLHYSFSWEELTFSIQEALKKVKIKIKIHKELDPFPPYLTAYSKRLDKVILSYLIPSAKVLTLEPDLKEMINNIDNWSADFLDMKLV